MLVRVWSVWLIICFCRELPLKQNWPISSPSLEANSIGMKWYINIPRTFFKMVFFVFFRFGEINVFFLHFLCWWWWRWGGRSLARGVMSCQWYLYFLYYLPMGDVMFTFGSTSVFFEIHTTTQILRWRDLFLKLSWHLIWDSSCQTAERLTIFRQKSAQSG